MSKVAVVLFNLGGPDSRGAIKPFLMNFFMDKNIIGAIGMAVRVLASRAFDFTFDSSLAFATAADGAHGVSPENQAI